MLYCLSLCLKYWPNCAIFFSLCSATNWSQPSEIEGVSKYKAILMEIKLEFVQLSFMKLFLHRKISCMTTTLGWMQLVIETAIRFFFISEFSFLFPSIYLRERQMMMTSQWMRNNGKCFIQSRMQIVWFFLSQISSSCLFVFFQHFCMQKLLNFISTPSFWWENNFFDPCEHIFIIMTIGRFRVSNLLSINKWERNILNYRHFYRYILCGII